jgi:hypothetical protein
MLETILGKVKFIKEMEIIWGQKILGGNLHWPREVWFCFLVALYRDETQCLILTSQVLPHWAP